jgi:acyl dehydratase
MTTRAIAFRVDEASDRGPHTICSDHEFSRDVALPLTTIPETDAAHAIVVCADEADEMRFERDLGAGAARGIDKHPVDDGTPGRVETINVVLRFDLHRNDLVTIVKRRRSDHGRACRFDSVQHAPARELNHAGSHEGVGRDGIAPVATPVDDEHANAPSREEHRSRGAGATSSDNNDVIVEGGVIHCGSVCIARARDKISMMSSDTNQVWPGGMPRVGQVAERSRTVNVKDIERFTEISGDRNPLHYDEAVAKASRFGEIVVQGGVTSAILNALVAEDLPGPGTVFLQVNWSFKAPVRPGDTITGRAEVLQVRTDKPITTLKTSVVRGDGTLVLDGDAVCYTMPIARSHYR